MTIPQNPYIAGNPVGGTGAFIGRADVLREVTGVLHNPNRNAIVLYGQRRIGKTSLLQELRGRLAQEGKYFPVYMDLQDKAAWPLEKLLRALAQEISAALHTEVTLPESGDIPTAFRKTYISQVLAELPAEASIVLLLDEFDVLDNPAQGQAGADFFPYLRTFLEAKEGRLQFVFVIGRKPEDLSTLTLSIFKGIRSKRVSLLPQKDTWALVRLAERNHTLVWSAEALQAVWELTHGHPYLTQQLCEIVWENAYEAAEGDAPPTVRAEDVHAAVPETLESSANALQWLWDGLPAAEKYVAAVLAEAGPQPVNQEELVHRLEESGVRIVIHELQNAPQILKEWDLLEEAPGGYRFRVELLRRWIVAKKPVQQVYQELENIKPLAQNLYEAGRRFYQSGQLERAAAQLRQALEANPNHARAGLLLAQILLAQGKVDEAVAWLEKIYAYNPGLARPHLVQALLQQAEAMEDEGARWERYAHIPEISPGHREAVAGRRAILEARAKRAEQAGNLEEALALYRRIQRDAPKEISGESTKEEGSLPPQEIGEEIQNEYIQPKIFQHIQSDLERWGVGLLIVALPRNGKSELLKHIQRHLQHSLAGRDKGICVLDTSLAREISQIFGENDNFDFVLIDEIEKILSLRILEHLSKIKKNGVRIVATSLQPLDFLAEGLVEEKEKDLLREVFDGKYILYPWDAQEIRDYLHKKSVDVEVRGEKLAYFLINETGGIAGFAGAMVDVVKEHVNIKGFKSNEGFDDIASNTYLDNQSEFDSFWRALPVWQKQVLSLVVLLVKIDDKGTKLSKSVLEKIIKVNFGREIEAMRRLGIVKNDSLELTSALLTRWVQWHWKQIHDGLWTNEVFRLNYGEHRSNFARFIQVFLLRQYFELFNIPFVERIPEVEEVKKQLREKIGGAILIVIIVVALLLVIQRLLYVISAL